MEALECIASRRSIRRYEPRPVDEELVEALLAAAMAAPSAGNQQPWRFVVVRSRETLMRMTSTSPYAEMLPEAGLAIVICGDTTNLRHPDMWQHDCAAATQNLLLAAHALGLGAVWLGYYPHTERSGPLAELLGIPEHVLPLSVVSVGHPAEHKDPGARYNSAFVHSESW